MKCLENLSLVNDECMEDLMNDIETLIEGYINIQETIVNLFDKIKYNLHGYEISRINKILFETETFLTRPPVLISQSGWEEGVLAFFDLDDPEEQRKLVKTLFEFMEQISIYDIDVDIENCNYWMYREGANGELCFDDEETFLKDLELLIPQETTETQLRILKVLKKAEKRIQKK